MKYFMCPIYFKAVAGGLDKFCKFYTCTATWIEIRQVSNWVDIAIVKYWVNEFEG